MKFITEYFPCRRLVTYRNKLHIVDFGRAFLHLKVESLETSDQIKTEMSGNQEASNRGELLVISITIRSFHILIDDLMLLCLFGEVFCFTSNKLN